MRKLLCWLFDHKPRHRWRVSPYVPTRCECSRCGCALPLYYHAFGKDENGKWIEANIGYGESAQSSGTEVGKR